MLPVNGNQMTHPCRNELSNAIDLSIAVPIFLGAPTNVEHNAKTGNATWQGNSLVISSLEWANYMYIPAVDHKISYCVFPSQGIERDFYVISDHFGGCEYHTLYNQTQKLFAVLHVFRGNGNTQQYQTAPGWNCLSVKRSSQIAQAQGVRGAGIWAISHIVRDTVNPVEQSQFIHLNGNLIVDAISAG